MPAFAPCKLYHRDQATGESNEVQLFTNNTESLEWLPLRSGEQFHHAGFLSLWRKVMSWSACMKPSNIGCDLSAAMGWVLKLHICNCSSFICVAPSKECHPLLPTFDFSSSFGRAPGRHGPKGCSGRKGKSFSRSWLIPTMSLSKVLLFTFLTGWGFGLFEPSFNPGPTFACIVQWLLEKNCG